MRHLRYFTKFQTFMVRPMPRLNTDRSADLRNVRSPYRRLDIEVVVIEFPTVGTG